MSFLKNILGAFVEFKEETKEKEVLQEAQNKGPDIPAVSHLYAQDLSGQQVQQTSIGTSSSIAPTNVPNQYQKHFQDLIDEANHKNPLFQGTDFGEFIQSKGDVEGIADEPTRYRTAFNVLKRTGLTKEKLVTTGREYVNIIDRDVKAFESVFIEQYKTQVELKERQLQQKAQELQTLNQKIEALNKEMKQIGQEVLSSKDRLNSNKNSFIAAADIKKEEIETELKKIDQYFS
jgi:valyl-tRNA synthetase